MGESQSDDFLSDFGGSDNYLLNSLIGDNADEDDGSLQSSCISKYADIVSLGTSLTSQKTAFTVMTLNIQGLNAKFTKLTTALQSLQEQNVHISAICIQECYFSKNQLSTNNGDDPEKIDTASIKIPGNDIYAQRTACDAGQNGGLVIYLHSDFKGN